MTIANKPDAAELRRLYVDNGLTQVQIAAMYGADQNTVKHWLRTHKITKAAERGRPSGNPKRVSWLDHTEAAATVLDCDAPEPDLITTATGAQPTPATLRRLHVDDDLSHTQIAEIYGVPVSTVKSWCRRAGLKGARRAAKAQSLAQFVEQARVRLAERDKAGAVEPAACAPSDPLATPATEAQLAEARALLAGISTRRHESAYAHVRAVLGSEVRYRRRLRMRQELDRHEKRELL